MTTLKGIFPNPKPPRKKNFLQENVKSLRQMEKYFHSHKEIQELQKLQFQKQQYNKYQNVAPRVNSSLRGSSTMSGDHHSANIKSRIEGQSLNRKSSTPVLSKGVETMTKKSSKSPGFFEANVKQKKEERGRVNGQATSKNLPKALLDLNINDNLTSPCNSPGKTKLINQGSQTLEADQMNLLYSEGTIRYPSTSRSQRKSPQRTDTKLDSNLSDRGDSPDSSLRKDNIDYVKLNKEKISVANRMAAQLNNGVVPPNYRKGVVPKYILERKEEQQLKELEKAKAEATHADCPEGHVPLPDNERRETLRMLKKNYQGFVDELNKMPIRSDTLRSQKRKMEIEKQLTKLEEGIKVFSRPKVFVKINA